MSKCKHSSLRWMIPIAIPFLVVLTATHAQTSAKKATPATGSVTGEVTCADTNAPARFAVVTLEPIPPEKPPEDTRTADEHPANATATTDLEGRFALDKVAAGRYYVIGHLAGYLNPLARFDPEQLKAMTEETRKELAKLVPVIDVEPGQSATVALRLEHASELSGTVLYDDGSPAVGLHIQLLQKGKDGKLTPVSSERIDWTGGSGSNATTDDRGRYRLTGMPPGEYAVRASLPTGSIEVGGLFGSGGISIDIQNEGDEGMSIYTGDVFRRKNARTFKVGEGDQVGGADITIAIGGLHSVRGAVTAKRDGHAVNRGQVNLLYADDQESARSVHVEEDGSFVLAYVPEEKYILRVSGAADNETVELHPSPQLTMRQDKPVRSYGDAEVPLLVQGDVSGLELAVPDVAGNKPLAE